MMTKNMDQPQQKRAKINAKDEVSVLEDDQHDEEVTDGAGVEATVMGSNQFGADENLLGQLPGMNTTAEGNLVSVFEDDQPDEEVADGAGVEATGVGSTQVGADENLLGLMPGMNTITEGKIGNVKITKSNTGGISVVKEILNTLKRQLEAAADGAVKNMGMVGPIQGGGPNNWPGVGGGGRMVVRPNEKYPVGPQQKRAKINAKDEVSVLEDDQHDEEVTDGAGVEATVMGSNQFGADENLLGQLPGMNTTAEGHLVSVFEDDQPDEEVADGAGVEATGVGSTPVGGDENLLGLMPGMNTITEGKIGNVKIRKSNTGGISVVKEILNTLKRQLEAAADGAVKNMGMVGPIQGGGPNNWPGVGGGGRMVVRPNEKYPVGPQQKRAKINAKDEVSVLEDDQHDEEVTDGAGVEATVMGSNQFGADENLLGQLPGMNTTAEGHLVSVFEDDQPDEEVADGAGVEATGVGSTQVGGDENLLGLMPGMNTITEGKIGNVKITKSNTGGISVVKEILNTMKRQLETAADGAAENMGMVGPNQGGGPNNAQDIHNSRMSGRMFGQPHMLRGRYPYLMVENWPGVGGGGRMVVRPNEKYPVGNAHNYGHRVGSQRGSIMNANTSQQEMLAEQIPQRLGVHYMQQGNRPDVPMGMGVIGVGNDGTSDLVGSVASGIPEQQQKINNAHINANQQRNPLGLEGVVGDGAGEARGRRPPQPGGGPQQNQIYQQQQPGTAQQAGGQAGGLGGRVTHISILPLHQPSQGKNNNQPMQNIVTQQQQQQSDGTVVRVMSEQVGGPRHGGNPGIPNLNVLANNIPHSMLQNAQQQQVLLDGRGSAGHTNHSQLAEQQQNQVSVAPDMGGAGGAGSPNHGGHGSEGIGGNQ